MVGDQDIRALGTKVLPADHLQVMIDPEPRADPEGG